VKIKLALSERVFICDACRHVADRDINAALNLAALAATEARSQGRTNVTIATPAATALVARGATDLDKRRSRRGGQATAMNRTGPLAGPPPENRRAA